MVPASDGGDDFIGIGGPDERFRALIVLGQEAVDGDLKIDERMEDTVFEASFGEPGEEALDGVEPRTGRWREMEGEARVPLEPLADLGVLVGGVVIENHVDRLAGGDLWTCPVKVERRGLS